VSGGLGDKGTRRKGEKEARGKGEKGKRRQGEKEARDKEIMKTIIYI
jgi:hypothetical protein